MKERSYAAPVTSPRTRPQFTLRDLMWLHFRLLLRRLRAVDYSATLIIAKLPALIGAGSAVSSWDYLTLPGTSPSEGMTPRPSAIHATVWNDQGSRDQSAEGTRRSNCIDCENGVRYFGAFDRLHY